MCRLTFNLAGLAKLDLKFGVSDIILKRIEIIYNMPLI